MRWLVAMMLGGCSFSPGASRDGAPTDDGGSDGAPDDALDDGRVIDSLPVTSCLATNPNLRACYLFEGNAMDGSGYDNHATATGISYVQGHTGMGIETTSGTIRVAEANSLDVANLAIKLWIAPAEIPSVRGGLVDSTGYRMFIEPGGTIRCALNDGAEEVFSATPVPISVFTRVSCTYDRQNLRLFFNGTEVGSAPNTASINNVVGQLTIGHNEPSGENFIGTLDDLEIWAAPVAP